MQLLLPLLVAFVPAPSVLAPAPYAGAVGQEDPSVSSSSPDAPELSEEVRAERSLAGRVDQQRAAKFVRELVALGPRMGGTESGARAAKLLEATFQGMQLDVVRHLAPKAWCHEETAWTVGVSIGGAESVAIERAWPWGFSPAGTGAALPLGLESSPGDALLVSSFRGTPRKGEPAAVVLCDDANTMDGEWPQCRPHPRRQRARVAAFGIPKADGDRLRAALAEGKPVTVDWSLKTTVEEAQAITVVAKLRPRKESPRPGHVLVCAHGDSDSGGPGANDNGSGVAIVVEMARAWTAAIAAGELAAPACEVRFAIWGSEIHSTRAYLESDLGADCICVLNFDQAGYGTTGQRLHVEPDDVPSNVAFVRIAAAVLSDHAGAEGFPAEWATNKSLGGTDSYVFSGNKRFRTDALPAVTMFTSAWGVPDEQPRTPGMPGESWRDREQVEMDYDVHYHSAGDTPENTTDKEPENMGWCARVGLITLGRWLERL